MSDEVIEASGLRKVFGKTVAVDELSFRLGRGEILGLLGPNGAGKTTAISMLLGLITPTAGRIRILGREMPKDRVAILERCNFSSAYVNLPSNLRVRENLTVFAKLYGVKRHRERIAELLDLFEVAPLAARVTGALSSGESTRVNLCKALLNEPELLLLDEPTASLDPDMADKVRRILRGVQRDKGISMLYTSHNMRDVEEVCDRVLFMNKGRLIAEGTPSEIKAKFGEQTLEQVFIKVARGGDLVAEGGAA
ncbi:MAG TPA: ABC transporter ATP-binding protein [Verrucomicrobiae bacterium]|nr:ABC transporter ATP-binding protein [Verrucomicrobiae bacterium]